MNNTEVLDAIKALKENINERFDDMKNEFNEMKIKQKALEERLVAVEKRTKELGKTEEQYKASIKKANATSIYSEYKSRELNVVFNNVPQEKTWEECSVSLQKAEDILREAMLIPERLHITHAHRIPKGGKANCRPLIITLHSMIEKQKIWDNLSNLKKYNDAQEDASNKRYVEMINLPNKLFVDKMSLRLKYKADKLAGKSPKWKYDQVNGEYYYEVDNTSVRPSPKAEGQAKAGE